MRSRNRSSFFGNLGSHLGLVLLAGACIGAGLSACDSLPSQTYPKLTPQQVAEAEQQAEQAQKELNSASATGAPSRYNYDSSSGECLNSQGAEGYNLEDPSRGASQECAILKTPLSISLVTADLQGSLILFKAEKLDLQGADLRGAIFMNGADLQGANFEGALLQGADLSRAKLDGADFRGASYSSDTRLPFPESEAQQLGMVPSSEDQGASVNLNGIY